MSIRTHKPGDPTQGLKVFQPGENIEFYGQQPKDVPEPVLQEMADWLVSERAPFAIEMMGVSDTLSSPSLPCKPNHDRSTQSFLLFPSMPRQEVQRLKEHKKSEAARNGKPEIQMEIARKYLIAFGKENAMSYAIEQRKSPVRPIA